MGNTKEDARKRSHSQAFPEILPAASIAAERCTKAGKFKQFLVDACKVCHHPGFGTAH